MPKPRGGLLSRERLLVGFIKFVVDFFENADELNAAMAERGDGWWTPRVLLGR